MTRWARIAGAVVLLAAACAAPAVAAQCVFVVRHAERETGQGDDGLSPAGKERAERLVRVLRDAGVTNVFTSDMRRTKETAVPLAAARALTPVAITVPESATMGGSGAEQQVRATVAAIRALPASAVVLVVGHSNTVGPILAGLGVTEPVTIGDAEFDNLFVALPRLDGPPQFLRLHY